VQSFSLYINTQHFREAGLDPDKDYPKTWDETLAIAKKLTKTDGGKITRQGFHFILINPTWVQFNFEPLVHQFGGDIVGPDGRCVMDGPAGVKALDLMASFVRGKVMDPSVTVATAAVAPGDFIQGVASMTVAHPATTDFIRQGNPAMWESKGFKVVPLPQVDASKPATMLNVNLFTINAATASSPAKLAAAHDFIRHLLAQPAQWLPRASSISPVKAARNAPEFKVDPFMDTYLSDVERGVIQTQSAYANELTSAMQRAEEAVLLSGADPQQALTHACQDVNRAIG
jgi:multiple sugar transport system substrate-binding protein